MTDYAERVRQDARLIMLKALAAQTDERLHSGYLVEELRHFGTDRTREWVHGELDWLADMGAVTLIKPGSVVVATLTEKGHRHLRRAIVIEGIKRPSRPGE
jgi:repressor of nif and glnA expression